MGRGADETVTEKTPPIPLRGRVRIPSPEEEAQEAEKLAEEKAKAEKIAKQRLEREKATASLADEGKINARVLGWHPETVKANEKMAQEEIKANEERFEKFAKIVQLLEENGISYFYPGIPLYGRHGRATLASPSFSFLSSPYLNQEQYSIDIREVKEALLKEDGKKYVYTVTVPEQRDELTKGFAATKKEAEEIAREAIQNNIQEHVEKTKALQAQYEKEGKHQQRQEEILKNRLVLEERESRKTLLAGLSFEEYILQENPRDPLGIVTAGSGRASDRSSIPILMSDKITDIKRESFGNYDIIIYRGVEENFQRCLLFKDGKGYAHMMEEYGTTRGALWANGQYGQPLVPGATENDLIKEERSAIDQEEFKKEVEKRLEVAITEKHLPYYTEKKHGSSLVTKLSRVISKESRMEAKRRLFEEEEYVNDLRKKITDEVWSETLIESSPLLEKVKEALRQQAMKKELKN